MTPKIGLVLGVKINDLSSKKPLIKRLETSQNNLIFLRKKVENRGFNFF